MSSNVKNPLSIDYDDDDDDYDKLKEFIETHTENQKNSLIVEMSSNYDVFIDEIEKRKDIANKKKKPYIKYILRKSKEYNKEQLMNFELSDVIGIYNELKLNKINRIKEIIKFLK